MRGCAGTNSRRRKGTLDQIEDGINGFVVPFNDAEALALRLKQLLENDELRAQMSEAALKSAQQKLALLE